LAEELQDSTARGRLLAMAQAWSRLAELAEKNARTDLVYEAGPVRQR